MNLIKARHRCLYCGSFVGKKPTKEHIVPKSKGGSNYGKNISISCNSCNNLRGSLSFSNFREKLTKLMESQPELRFKWQTMLVNLESVEEYAEKMGDKLKKNVKK